MSHFDQGWYIPTSEIHRPPRPLPPRVEEFLSGMKHKERRVWVPEVTPQLGESRFFRLIDDFDYSSVRSRWTNEPDDPGLWGGGKAMASLFSHQRQAFALTTHSFRSTL